MLGRQTLHISNPCYVNQEKTIIAAEFQDEHTGGILHFKDNPSLMEDDEMNLFVRIKNGELGVVKDYVQPTEAEIIIKDSENARYKRDKLLSSSDWTQLKDVQLASDKVEQYAAYRQALRDVTSQTGFPNDILWPVEPS